MLRNDQRIRRSKGGPRYQGIKLAISEDALNFKKLDRFLTEYGGVPCLITLSDGTIIASFQYFIPRRDSYILLDGTSIAAFYGGMAISRSIDNGETWSQPSKIRFRGLPDNVGGSACDPAMAILDDGRMRLYFTGRARTYSGISKDFEVFDVEEGIRFMDGEKMILDPNIIKIGSIWHYFAPNHEDPNRNYHAVSADGLNLKREKDIFGEGLKFLGNACAVDGGYRFYTTYNGVSSAFSKDGYDWVLEKGIRLSGPDVIGDVGVTKMRNGQYLMAYTTKQLREDPFE